MQFSKRSLPNRIGVPRIARKPEINGLGKGDCFFRSLDRQFRLLRDCVEKFVDGLILGSKGDHFGSHSEGRGQGEKVSFNCLPRGSMRLRGHRRRSAYIASP